MDVATYRDHLAAVKREIDQVFILRAIQTRFAPEASVDQLADVVAGAKLEKFKAGDTLFNEGEMGDCLHMVRVGSLTISRNIGGKDVVLSYVPAGNYIGEMALLGETRRSATARAAMRPCANSNAPRPTSSGSPANRPRPGLTGAGVGHDTRPPGRPQTGPPAPGAPRPLPAFRAQTQTDPPPAGGWWRCAGAEIHRPGGEPRLCW